MASVASALLYAIFVWWFSTGLVMLLVLRAKAIRASLVGAALLFPVGLYVLAKSSGQTGLVGVYLAFTASIVLWGTQEVGFLTGVLTGPRPLPCPAAARGLARAGYALSAILYHELALVASVAAVVAVTWGGANQAGTLTFLVLWVMRVSAKLNLFLGVPVLNDGFLPEPIAYVRSYFRRDAVNPFFPVSILVSVLLTCGLVGVALDPEASTAAVAGYTLVAALMGLAILEHLFMLVPLPIDRLWQWSMRARPSGRREARHVDLVTVDRVLPRAPDGAARASSQAGFSKPGPTSRSDKPVFMAEI